MAWSEKYKNLTREKAGDGAIMKNEKGQGGFFSSNGNGVKIMGISCEMGFPLPTKEVIATFSDIEAMIDAGWVID